MIFYVDSDAPGAVLRTPVLFIGFGLLEDSLVMGMLIQSRNNTWSQQLCDAAVISPFPQVFASLMKQWSIEFIQPLTGWSITCFIFKRVFNLKFWKLSHVKVKSRLYSGSAYIFQFRILYFSLLYKFLNIKIPRNVTSYIVFYECEIGLSFWHKEKNWWCFGRKCRGKYLDRIDMQ
jgi:hypothetical protein